MKTLFKFKNFVDEINKENGRLYKQAVLEKYKDDEDIKYYLHWVFSPFVITGISTKKLHKSLSYSQADYEDKSLVTVYDVLKYIKEHNTGTDSTLKAVNAFIEINPDFPVELCQIFDAIITKDISIGVDAKTINKVLPNLIPEFNVQLAEKYFEDPERIEGKDFAITTKIDGGRIIAIKENGKVTFYTRQGQVYEGLIDLEEEMTKYMPDNICLDGEITLLEPGMLTSKDQYKQTMKITRADGEKHGVKMLVFDFMTAEDFRNQKCDKSYSTRRECLDEIFYGFGEAENHKFTYFNLLPILYKGNDTKMIGQILDEQVANSEEGIMLNIMDAAYEFKRTWNIQKVKKMQTLDLEIIDYFDGDKSFTGMLGGFIVRYKDGNSVRVGSGFDKEFRIEAWKNPKQYIGKLIEVQYFEETTNQNGGISLRFPIFKDFRTDKVEADY